MYDNALWGAKRYLKENNIHFQPGLNEDLAATAVWGSQQTNLFPERHGRWRVRHLVRQGPGRRPLDGRAEARQCRRHLAVWRRDRAGRRRPWLPVLDPAAPERAGLRRGDDPGRQSGDRPGVSRLRHPGLRDVALHGLLDRLQGDLRDRRKRRLGMGRSRAHQDRDADRLPASRRRARHPQSRSAARGREAPARAEDGRGARLRARQRLRPHGDRAAARAHRHHDHRQGLSRHAPGARGSRPQRGALQVARHPPLQGRRHLAARAGRRAALRRGPAGSHRHRGEALQPRGPARPHPLQRAGRPPAAGDRQDRRGQPHPLPERGRAVADRRRHGDRQPADEAHRRLARAASSAWPASKPRSGC